MVGCDRNEPRDFGVCIRDLSFDDNLFNSEMSCLLVKQTINAILPLLLLPAAAFPQQAPTVPESAIARGLEWVGVVVEEPEYTIWGASPIMGQGGTVHLFVARWSEDNVDPAWRKSSEIAHYTAESCEGPFQYVSTVLRGTGAGSWDSYAPHNPEIRKFGNTYALLYIANDDYHQPPHPFNQCIGMAVSRSLYGPWEKVNGDGLILRSSPDENHWTHGSQVVNPAILMIGDRFHLYFKARYAGGTGYGLALADRLVGPYVMEDQPLTSDGIFIEDASSFIWKGMVCLLTTDNHGKVTGVRGGGALWVSRDGIHFDAGNVQLGYDRVPRYFDSFDPSSIVRIYGGDPKLERPKVLMMDGKPRCLYAPSGWALHGGKRTACYVLRINLDKNAGPLPTEE